MSAIASPAERPATRGPFVTLTRVAEELAVSPQKALRIVRAGHITIRRLPGCRADYSLADVHRLTEVSIEPGSVGAEI